MYANGDVILEREMKKKLMKGNKYKIYFNGKCEWNYIKYIPSGSEEGSH